MEKIFAIKQELDRQSGTSLKTLSNFYGIKDLAGGDEKWMLAIEISKRKRGTLNQAIKEIDFEEYFESIQKLGEGGYGRVDKCKAKKDFGAVNKGDIVAIKVMPRDRVGIKVNQSNDEMSKEVETLMELSNAPACRETIVCYYGHFTTADPNAKYGIIMQLVDGVGMNDFVYSDLTDYTAREIWNLMLAMAKTLKTIHDAGIAHKDLKTENIIIQTTPTLRPVFIDFGLACLGDTNHAFSCEPDGKGTLTYFSPERISQMSSATFDIYKAADMWALGNIFHELVFSGYMPTPMEDVINQATKDNSIVPLKFMGGVKALFASLKSSNSLFDKTNYQPFGGCVFEDPIDCDLALTLLEDMLIIDYKKRATADDVIIALTAIIS